jgi:creatinine amidohydrolase
VLAYGVTPLFAGYPGSPSLRVETYAAVVRELLSSLHAQGFRRVLVVNGHGGNSFARAAASEWAVGTEGAQVVWNDWWIGPKVSEACTRLDPVWSHAAWSENFPWTRLADVVLPDGPKESVLPLPPLDASSFRERAGDGSFGGAYAKPDDAMLEIWRIAVEETRTLLEDAWR